MKSRYYCYLRGKNIEKTPVWCEIVYNEIWTDLSISYVMNQLMFRVWCRASAVDLNEHNS